MNDHKKRSFYLEVWRDLEGKLIGSDATNTKGFPELKEWFEYHYTVHGSTATVYLFFSDYDIRNEELKVFAIKFMKGEYITYNIDLKNDWFTTEKGIDKTINPH